MKYHKWKEYFKYSDNWVDIFMIASQIINLVFSLLFFMYYEKPESYIDVCIRIFQMMTLIFTFIKIMYFIRYWEALTRYIILIFQTFIATYDFFQVFMLFNVIFALLYINIYVDDPGTDGDHKGQFDFEGVTYGLRMLLFQFSNSIGDLGYPEAPIWTS